jgi:FAD/FMN-containing dehydrogenase
MRAPGASGPASTGERGTCASEKAAMRDRLRRLIGALGGSFAAEHGIGLSRLATLRARKDPVALAAMRAIRAALDPAGILNPGKTVV